MKIKKTLAPEQEVEMPDGFTVDDFVRDFCIKGSTVDNPKVAAWNGHEFEVLTGKLYSYGLHFRNLWEQGLIVYHPIDPRMTEEDVRGATIAYPNDDNDGWMFRHCDADYHIDHEYRLLAACTAAFEDQVHQLDVALNNAMQAAIASDSGRAVLGTFRHTYDELGKFRTSVKQALITEARGRHIGYFHQNPHEAHIHEPLSRAIAAAIEAWKENRATQYETIKIHVEIVQRTVDHNHGYETRWDKKARLAAEKIAAPGKGVDPVDGYEYCFVRVLTPNPITDPANLPDPNWNFDQLASGYIDRGDLRYWDAEPQGSQFIFYAIRFKRPIPEGTKPGADIGSVAWEQEAPYLNL